MTSPHERTGALLTRLDEVRQRALQLRAKVAHGRADAHTKLVQADFEGAERAKAEVAAAQRELDLAESAWRALEAAHKDVDTERQRADWTTQLAAQREAMRAAQVQAHQHAAEVVPLMIALRQALEAAESADREANEALDRVNELRVALGDAEHSRIHAAASAAGRSLRDRFPILVDLARVAV